MMMPKPDPKPRARAEAKPLQQTLPATPPAALQQATTLGILMGQAAARAAGNGAATAALVPLATRLDTWNGLLAMQSAVWQRTQQLQQGWLQGWTGWLQEFVDLKRANTLSEHMELQYNLVAQVGALLKNQASDVLNLQENVQVAYGYWVGQQAKAATA